MKVMLESIGGKRYPIEVGDSCTLQELKEKVLKFLEIPIARQILSFNGNILRQDTDLLHVKNESVIKFLVTNDPFSSPLPFPAPTPKPEVDILHFLLEISASETIAVKACGGDTVRELKEKIQGNEGTPADQILITTEEGMEIPDYRRLRDYAISFSSGVTVEFLSETQPRKSRLLAVPSPSPPPSPSRSPSPSPSRSRSPSPSPTPSPSPRKKSRLSVMSSATSSSTPEVDAEKLSLVLFFRGIRMPEPVEVRRESMVREMRARLEAMKFKAPGNREYCFYHKQTLLDEDRSFASQNVANRDIIYISPGSIKRNNVS